MAISGIINTNINALNTLGALSGTSSSLSTYIQQLSTGKQINGPADNPAGYSIAQRFQTQINGLNQAVSNGNQAVSLVQTATGALQNETTLLQQIRTISVQAANGSNTSADRQSLQGVVSQLLAQVQTIATQTQFNGQNLLDGTFTGQQFQVGANADQTINVSIAGANSNQIGLNTLAATTAGDFGSATGNVTSGGYGAAFTFTSSTGSTGPTGAFGTAAVSVSGYAGSKATAALTATESAASVATAINGISSSTGVTASARTSVTLQVANGSYSFSLGNGNGTVTGQTNGVNITATVSGGDLTSLVSSINNGTAQTGIQASVDGNGNLVLTQSQGQNIALTNFTATGTGAGFSAITQGGTQSIAATTTAGTTGAGTATTGNVLFQGFVQFQSTQGFSIDSTSAGKLGVGAQSSLSSVGTVNVSTIGGANQAIGIIDQAINALNTQGGTLGAIQQRVQASVQNSQTAATNLQSAQSVVQDANIAAATTQLSKYQILQQAGISTLAQANALQQSYLKLLP